MEVHSAPQTTVCPRCAAEVLLVEGRAAPRVLRGGRRIAFDTWELRRESDYFHERTVVEFPPEFGREPEALAQEMSQRAYVWVTAIPIACSAFFVALILPQVHANHLVVLMLMLLFSLVPLAFIGRRDPGRTASERELVEAFWEGAAPDFHPNGLQPGPLQMVGDVCRHELAEGAPVVRYGELLRQWKLGEEALRERPADRALAPVPFALAPIVARKLGHDGPTPSAESIVDAIAPAAVGELPLSYAEALLGLLPAAAEDREIRVRLRVLLCQRWFEAGWQPRSLNLMGKLFPNLGRAVASENEAGLWNLYTLWKRGKVHDWKTLGEVETVFALAADPSPRSDILLKEPDLLMVIQRSGEWRGTEEHFIILCEEGLFFDGKKVAGADAEVKAPRETVRRLRAWAEYYFETFQHYVEYHKQQEKAAYHDLLWKQRLIRCANCQAVYLGVPGEAGIAVGEVA